MPLRRSPLGGMIEALQREQTAHPDYGVVTLNLLSVNASGKHVDDLAAMGLVSKTLEGKRILPETIEHGLNDVLTFVNVDLVIEERVIEVRQLSAEIVMYGLSGE